ncbi:DUF1847 domain-containing protein [Dehalococcoidia bacterium]|nr:DUF1847 domain-containing protein [Dehalococcoidia bacterium]MCL0095572.1 DUF1847 domain-containing protein [Dehalococcoidia bacterium]
MAKNQYPHCARCPRVVCLLMVKADEELPLDEAPAFCPMKLMPEIIARATAEYDKPEVREFARLASVQEFECYEFLPEGRRTKIPRVEELIQFAHKCGYKRLGLAFCAGLANEARILTDVLENKGFEVVSVRCKVGATPKERIGIREEEKIRGPGWLETMCNPIVQAEVLNHEKVDLAIMLGLCMGHDTLFIQYCRVPMTVLAVKDRVFGHNPLAALYLADSPYYDRLMAKTTRPEGFEPPTLGSEV